MLRLFKRKSSDIRIKELEVELALKKETIKRLTFVCQKLEAEARFEDRADIYVKVRRWAKECEESRHLDMVTVRKIWGELSRLAKLEIQAETFSQLQEEIMNYEPEKVTGLGFTAR